MQPGLNQNVAVLFCRKNSNYKNMVSECYDIDRDARTFDLEIPVIALLQWEEQKQETEIKKNFQKAGENERRTF